MMDIKLKQRPPTRFGKELAVVQDKLAQYDAKGLKDEPVGTKDTDSDVKKGQAKLEEDDSKAEAARLKFEEVDSKHE